MMNGAKGFVVLNPVVVLQDPKLDEHEGNDM
jgi:hypothetical protein